jgi:hypothetical protein
MINCTSGGIGVCVSELKPCSLALLVSLSLVDRKRVKAMFQMVILCTPI